MQVRSPGHYLLPYAGDLTGVLNRALKLSCREGYQLAGAVLSNVLRSLTTIYPTDYRSVSECRHNDSEYLPLRDWGRPGDVNNLRMKWHMPSPEERAFAGQLLQCYLFENLQLLQRHTDASSGALPREVLQRTLSHSLDCVLGSGALLPPWDEPALPISKTGVDLALPIHTSHPGAKHLQISFADGANIRLTVAKTV